MVREYLESVLEKTEKELREYSAQYKEKQNLKQNIESSIKKIQMRAELDVEYFSPRQGSQSLRGQMDEFYAELETVVQKIEELQEKMAVLMKEKEKFQTMLDEVVDLERRANNVSRETSG